MTFTLPGFNAVKREASSSSTLATVSAELQSARWSHHRHRRIAAVDVQSTRVQNIIDKEVLAAIPTSRGATGIQSLVPGMSSNGDAGGITGGSGGMAGFIPGARASDSRTLHDGINTGWAGANSNAAVSNVAGSQETVLTVSGGLGEAETAARCSTSSRATAGTSSAAQCSYPAPAAACRAATTPTTSEQPDCDRPRSSRKSTTSTRWVAVASSGQIVVLRDVPRGCRREHDSGHLLQPERRRSDQMARRLRHQPSLLRGQRDPKCDRATHLAGVTAQQSEFQPLPAATGRTRKAAAPRRTPEAQGLRLYTPGFIQTATWASPITNRLLAEAGWGNYFSVYANLAPRIDGTHNPDLISILEQCSAGCPNNGGIAGLIYRYNLPLQQGFERHQIGTIAQTRAAISPSRARTT